MTERPIAKRTRVREIVGLLDISANVVRDDADLISVARAAIAHPSTRLLAVVDADDRIVGVLPVLRVVEEVVAHANPETLLAEVTDLESAVRFGREIGARVARDLMSKPVVLTLDSTVRDAFHAMHEGRYSGLPVVDAERRVIGYVDLLELALAYLEDASRRAPVPPEPPRD